MEGKFRPVGAVPAQSSNGVVGQAHGGSYVGLQTKFQRIHRSRLEQGNLVCLG